MSPTKETTKTKAKAPSATSTVTSKPESMHMPLKPRVSEKAYGVSEKLNTYVFQVPVDSNKQTIGEAVSSQYQVTVKTVNIVRVKGKVKRTVRKGGKASTGKRSDFKKAYVTLAEGSSITIFTVEEDDKKSKKSGGVK